jgi:hypothetical protein
LNRMSISLGLKFAPFLLKKNRLWKCEQKLGQKDVEEDNQELFPTPHDARR